LPRKSGRPTAVDLFAGCGGLSLGLEHAGFEPIYVNELNKDALQTYLINRSRRYPSLVGPRRHSSDIFEITSDDAVLSGLASELRAEHGEIDLVVGGPPCQGYSGIGHRRTFSLSKADIPSNHLYREMAKVIRAMRPRAFIFENVKGLLSGRWTPDGEKGGIWADVRRAFEDIDGYEVRWSLVQAKSYGVPQNRPRILMVGVRRDLGWTPSAGPADGLLPAPTGTPPDPEDFLGDLVDSDYLATQRTERYPRPATTSSQEWFRRDAETNKVLPARASLTEQEYSRHDPRIVAKFAYMLANGGRIRPEDQTKKFAQRVVPRQWGATGPSITATSLPDDYVHFSQPRTFTVREWARIQTFPDWYQFAGKRTTGGRRRAGDPSKDDWSREVPKYTQIGNAVPVWLAREVGKHLIQALELTPSSLEAVASA
jgi:DNA (cytosine-5)-methyltransferase 1